MNSLVTYDGALSLWAKVAACQAFAKTNPFFGQGTTVSAFTLLELEKREVTPHFLQPVSSFHLPSSKDHFFFFSSYGKSKLRKNHTQRNEDEKIIDNEEKGIIVDLRK